jgi:hypothetical protein
MPPPSGIVEEKQQSLTGVAKRAMDSDAEEGMKCAQCFLIDC